MAFHWGYWTRRLAQQHEADGNLISQRPPSPESTTSELTLHFTVKIGNSWALTTHTGPRKSYIVAFLFISLRSSSHTSQATSRFPFVFSAYLPDPPEVSLVSLQSENLDSFKVGTVCGESLSAHRTRAVTHHFAHVRVMFDHSVPSDPCDCIKSRVYSEQYAQLRDSNSDLHSRLLHSSPPTGSSTTRTTWLSPLDPRFSV